MMGDKVLDFPRLGNVDIAMLWLKTPWLIEELRYAGMDSMDSEEDDAG